MQRHLSTLPNVDADSFYSGISKSYASTMHASDPETDFDGDMPVLESMQVRMGRFTNRFVDAPILEELYMRVRLKEGILWLRIVSLLLIGCFATDCIFENVQYPWLTRQYLAITVSLCALFCLLLLPFLLRSHYSTYLCGTKYHLIALAMGCVGFLYVIFSDLITACYIIENEDQNCSLQLTETFDSRRSTLGFVLLLITLPFCYRVPFVHCLWLFPVATSCTIAIYAYALARSLISYDFLVIETCFFITLVLCTLISVYTFERNDRLIFLRMEHYNQIQTELKQVKEELTWAADEANTNEMKLEIELAKSKLDQLSFGARRELERYVIPFDNLSIDKLVGRGSCGEVFQGRLLECTKPDLTTSVSSSSLDQFVEMDELYQQDIGNEIVVAVKRIPKHDINERAIFSMLQETLLISRCKHPNILRLLGLLYDPYVCLVYEFMHFGSVKDLLEETRPKTRQIRNGPALARTGFGSFTRKSIESFNADKIAQMDERRAFIEKFSFKNGRRCWTPLRTRMCIDIANGISYLHSMGIVHRDLKSSNLLMDSSHQVKLADFGTAKLIDGTLGNLPGGKPTDVMSRVGTPLWVAPEVISGDGGYDFKCDVWAFGIILCEIISSRDPYTTQDGKSHFNLCEVVDGGLNPVDFILKDFQELHVPPALLALVRDCCQLDPEKRCSMKDALFKLLEIAVQEEVSTLDPLGHYEHTSSSRESKRRSSIGMDFKRKSLDTPLNNQYSASCFLSFENVPRDEFETDTAIRIRVSDADEDENVDLEAANTSPNPRGNRPVSEVLTAITTPKPLSHCKSTITMGDMVKRSRTLASTPKKHSSSFLSLGPLKKSSSAEDAR